VTTTSSSHSLEDFEFDATKISLEEARRLPDEYKYTYFKSVRVAHLRHREILGKIIDLSHQDSGTDVVLLVGPTGVGKSTLIHDLKKTIIRNSIDALIADPGYTPIVVIVSPSSGENKFSWRMFFRTIGQGMDEPLMDSKHRIEMVGDRSIVRFVTSESTVAGMKMAIENVFRGRRTGILVVDESTKMLRVVSGKTLGIHIDAIQSLCDIPELTLVLAGAYDLLEIPTLSGQIARRSRTIHYSRYQLDGGKDEAEFNSVLDGFMNRWILNHRFDVEKWRESLYVASIGCCGILKTILNNAFKLASTKSKWDDNFIKTSVFTKGAYESILSETLYGEERIIDFIHSSDPIKDLKELKRELELKQQLELKVQKRANSSSSRKKHG
jgi:hypothetical protein